MSIYNPEKRASRVALARQLLTQLTAWGFEEIRVGASERVYARAVSEGLQCRVYTSVVGDAMRPKAADAIRVCLFYTGEPPRIIGSERSVHRVGEVDAIVGRVKVRIDRASQDFDRCHCGAPKFKSGRGNLVCAALCWKRAPKPAAKPEPRLRMIKPQPAEVAIAAQLARPAGGPIHPADFETLYRGRAADAPRGKPW